MSETLEMYRRLADAFSGRIEAVPDSGWDAQSPCPDWTARDVVAHVIGVARRNLGMLDAGAAPPPAAGDFGAIIADITAAGAAELDAAGSPAAGWKGARADVEAALADPDRAAQMVTTLMGPMPFETLIGRIVATDLLVHTWDLSRAAGLDEQLDPEVLSHAYEGMKPMDEMLRAPGFFGDKVEPPAGADLQTQFLAFLGRKA